MSAEGFDFFAYEKRAHSKGYRLVAGVDEAGRGPLQDQLLQLLASFLKDLLLKV